MKFLCNIWVSREKVRPVRRAGFRIYLQESTLELLGQSLCNLAGEAPAL